LGFRTTNSKVKKSGLSNNRWVFVQLSGFRTTFGFSYNFHRVSRQLLGFPDNFSGFQTPSAEGFQTTPGFQTTSRVSRQLFGLPDNFSGFQTTTAADIQTTMARIQLLFRTFKQNRECKKTNKQSPKKKTSKQTNTKTNK
jgi:hypothetical protein